MKAKKETCEACCAVLKGTEVMTCDGCHAALLRGLLSCPRWLTWRGIAKGDLPGETLADSLKRELRALESQEGGATT